MLTDEERAGLKDLEFWQYPKVPGGFRRVVVFVRHNEARISREILVETARSLEFDADDQFTVDFRGIGSPNDLAALDEARQVFREVLPNLGQVRVTLKRGAVEAVPALRDCRRCVDLEDAAPPEDLPPGEGSCEAFFRITPANQEEAPGWIGPLFQAGYNPITVEVDHSLDWSEADLTKLEATLIRLGGVWSFFRDAGLRLLDREWICRGSRGPHCGVGAETTAIAPDGFQYACARFVGYDPTQAVGHVLDSLWIEMWSRYAHYRACRNRVCGGYPVQHECLAGCAYLNMRNNGDLFSGVASQCLERRLRVQLQGLY